MKEYFGLKINSTAVDEMVKFDLETLISAKRLLIKLVLTSGRKKKNTTKR